MSACPHPEPAPGTAAPPSPLEQHSTFERIEQAARLATQVPSGSTRTEGALKAAASLLLAWRERRFVAGVCRDMLRLYADAVAHQPGSPGPALYHRILAARHGGSTVLADAILERAGESFAQWPSPRALTFRDVVHYVAILEYIAANRGARWIHADLKRLVNDSIPRAL